MLVLLVFSLVRKIELLWTSNIILHFKYLHRKFLIISIWVGFHTLA